jgi:hypothetical protein
VLTVVSSCAVAKVESVEICSLYVAAPDTRLQSMRVEGIIHVEPFAG